MRRLTSILIPVLLAIPAATTAAPAIPATPGQPAPPLMASRWLRGEPVGRFEAGQVYVVYLWSTWCKPCLSTMPILSAVQARHGTDVTVIAMSVWEMRPRNVPDFVTKHADSMLMTVAMDSIPPGKEANEGLTAFAWIGTSEDIAIPKTYLVDRAGRVAWVGDPRALEEPLNRLLAGTWDTPSFAERHAAGERTELRYREQLRVVEAAVGRADWEEALRQSENLAAQDTSFAARAAHQGFARIALAILDLKEASPAARGLGQRAAERALALEPVPDAGLLLLAARAARGTGDTDATRRHLTAAIAVTREPEARMKLQAELDSLEPGR